MANDKVALKKDEVEVPVSEKKVKAYKVIIVSMLTHLSDKKFYMHANGDTYECNDGDEIIISPLAKEILDLSVRLVQDPKTKRMIREQEYKYNIIATIYE